MKVKEIKKITNKLKKQILKNFVKAFGKDLIEKVESDLKVYNKDLKDFKVSKKIGTELSDNYSLFKGLTGKIPSNLPRFVAFFVVFFTVPVQDKTRKQFEDGYRLELNNEIDFDNLNKYELLFDKEDCHNLILQEKTKGQMVIDNI